jgi:hypothetical protein
MGAEPARSSNWPVCGEAHPDLVELGLENSVIAAKLACNEAQCRSDQGGGRQAGALTTKTAG